MYSSFVWGFFSPSRNQVSYQYGYTVLPSQDVSVKTGFDWKCCSHKTENTARFAVKNSTNLNVGGFCQMTAQSFSEQLCLISCGYYYYSDFQAKGFKQPEQFPMHCYVFLFGAAYETDHRPLLLYFWVLSGLEV